MQWMEFVFGIIVVCTIGSVLKARYGVIEDKDGNDTHVDRYRTEAENEQLKGEMKALKERIQVLERLATDDTSARRLDDEIARLRDRT